MNKNNRNVFSVNLKVESLFKSAFKFQYYKLKDLFQAKNLKIMLNQNHSFK